MSKTSIIEIENMQFHAFHGCYAEEQVVGNPCTVHLAMRVDTTKAEESDSIADTLNYQLAYELVAEEMMQTSHILEHVAKRILRRLFAEFQQLEWAQVKVVKHNPPMGGQIDGVAVTLARTREEMGMGIDVGAKAEEENRGFGEMMALMRRLRRDCPWDRKQTIGSLRQYTLEEVYELADAIVDNSDADIRKELGDLLMHVLFYALIAEEEGRFDILDVIRGENEKLVYRHPHVFGPNPTQDADEVERQWEALKLKEKGGNRRVLQGVPKGLPALVKAMRIQEKAAAAGFDWTIREDVWGKVREELEETLEAMREGDSAHMQEEFGDLLFAVVNAARLYDVDPGFALELANRKFMSRFNHVEARTLESGRQLQDMTLDEMEAFWGEAKRIERGEGVE